jgi:hypothetical protein
MIGHHGRFVVDLLLEMWIVGIVDRWYWDMSFWIADPLAVDQRSKMRCARGFLRSWVYFSKTLEERERGMLLWRAVRLRVQALSQKWTRAKQSQRH